jgi:TDG/mug DNA glycosylase family protein
VRHHFARPGNRFWRVLHAAGFTERLLSPFEERELLSACLGITNLVARATASAGELSPDELIRGAARLVAKVQRRRPAVVAFLGLDAYRTALARPAAVVGPQAETIGDANVWVLPNPSGLNARYQLPALARLFSVLRRAAFRARGG